MRNPETLELHFPSTYEDNSKNDNESAAYMALITNKWERENMNTNNSRNKGAKSTSKLDQPPSNITDLAKSLGKRVLYLIGSAILFESLQNVKQIYDIKCID